MAKKTYVFNLDMNCSLDIRVKAKNAADAKKLAFERFKKKISRKHLTMTHYDIYDNEGWPI